MLRSRHDIHYLLVAWMVSESWFCKSQTFAWNFEPEFQWEQFNYSISHWRLQLAYGSEGFHWQCFSIPVVCLRTLVPASWLLVWMKLILSRWAMVCEHRWRRNSKFTGRAHTWETAREKKTKSEGRGTKQVNFHLVSVTRENVLLWFLMRVYIASLLETHPDLFIASKLHDKYPLSTH